MAEGKKRSHKKKDPNSKKEVVIKAKPKQQDLPGMEDRALEPLENLAEKYVDVRDQRMELTRRESQMSADLLAMMHKYEKVEYHHGEVHIWVKVTEEKVRVKLGEIPAKATDFEPDVDEDTPTNGVAVSTQGQDAAVEGDF